MFCAFFFGFGQALLTLRWIVDAFAFQATLPPALGWIGLILPAGYLAFYWTLAAIPAWLLERADPLRFAVAFAAAFTFSEWVRGTVLTGFPWNPIGVIWLDVPPIASLASLTGTLGLSGLTVLLSGLLAPTALLDDRARALAGVVLLVAIAGASILSIRQPADTTTRIVVVQPNISQDEKWRPGQASDHLQRHLLLSETKDDADRARLLFWPETAITTALNHDAETQRLIGSVLGEYDLLFAGDIGAMPGPDRRPRATTNSVFVIGAGGEIRGRYDKIHLVPFGEYLPMPNLLGTLGLSRLIAGSAPFVAGSGARSLQIDGLTASIDICYEIIFAGAVVDPRIRPQFLFNSSNDAWFGHAGPPQHLAQARMRAIEEGLPVIRATTNGISAVIRADGSIAASLPWRTAGRIETVLPGQAPATFFSARGNIPALTVSLLAFGALSLTGRTAPWSPRSR